jgi:uncharacterized surface protein with fasciclin (FAS1) repeats
MKHNLARIAAVAAFALVLAACGGDDGTDDTTTTSAPAPETTAAPTTTSAPETTAAPTTTSAPETTAAPTTTAAPAGDTIADIVVGNENFSTLLAAVQAAGLTDALADPNATLTVFAPTNEAFAAALDALGLTAEELLADTETLTAILTYHVLGDVVTSGDIISVGTEEVTVEALGGEDLTVVVTDGGGVTFRDQDATVTTADVEASNGVIHVIDGVLLPPSLSG